MGRWRYVGSTVGLLIGVLGPARATQAQAQTASPAVSARRPDPGVERHDGFMLRLTFGLGWSSALASADGTSDDFTLSGLSGSGSLDIGGAITENLVLHARLSNLWMTNPSISRASNYYLSDSDTAPLSGFLLGPAITYYFMPANIYLTAALGVSWITRDRASETTSDAGFGSNLDIGKEWWVSDDWGLGVAASFWFTHATDSLVVRVDRRQPSPTGVDFTYNVLGSAVFFSATYN